MIPSRRFYGLLGSAIIIAMIVAIIVNQQISFLFLLGFNLIIFGAALLDNQRTISNRVEVSRFPLTRLSIGQDNLVELSLRCKERRAQVLLQDHYPVQFSVSQEILSVTLSPNCSEIVTYTIHPDCRGEFPWGDIQMRQLGSWGLIWHSWTVPSAVKVKVYPDLVGLRSLSVRLAIENTGTMRQIRRLGMGTEFSELREYRVGDDTRFIDWKATARRSRPLVRVLEPEKEQTLIVLLDRGRLMTAQVQGIKRFDWGLNATLSLALAGLNRGDRVGVGVFDREITTWIPPERGQHQFSNLLERLSPIQPLLLEPDYFGAVTRLVTQQTRRALVVLITDLVDITASSELLAALTRLTPRYLPFCVTLRDPQVDTLAHTPVNLAASGNATETLTAAYSRAVALDLIAQRQVAFAQLKQQGVLVLDAPANQISERIVDRYLQLKARNLL